MTLSMNVGSERLKQWREANTILQRAVGFALDVDTTRVSSWERGSARPTLAQAVRLERFTDGYVKCEHWFQEAEQVAV